jgi:hypothetical protein
VSPGRRPPMKCLFIAGLLLFVSATVFSDDLAGHYLIEAESDSEKINDVIFNGVYYFEKVKDRYSAHVMLLNTESLELEKSEYFWMNARIKILPTQVKFEGSVWDFSISFETWRFQQRKSYHNFGGWQ